MDLSIIIISFNTRKLTKQCIDSVRKHAEGISYEIIVVDNASTDRSVEMLRKQKIKKDIHVIFNTKNKGFAAANNQGAQKAKGEVLLFLNSDTIVHENALKKTLSFIKQKSDVGIVSCMLKNEDGSIQGTGGFFPTLTRVFSWMTIQDIPGVDTLIKPFHPGKEKAGKGTVFYTKTRELDWVTGAFLMMRHDVFDEVKGWDEKYFMYTEDTDICYRAKQKDWKVWYYADAAITHLGGKSSTVGYPIIKEYEGVKKFYRKHYPRWQYPILRLFLKIGALGRIVLFGILEGRRSAHIYVEAFRQA